MTEHEHPGPDRQARAAHAFVEIVDTLVDRFDVIDVLTLLASRCVELLDTSAAGILLVDDDGNLRVMGASTEQIGLLELFQIQNEQGPCLDCFRNGVVVTNADLAAGSPWPLFAEQSIAAGFLSVCAVPMRFRDLTIGCLNLFVGPPRALLAADVTLARALADVATIAIMQDQATRAAAIREGRLQSALVSRIAIEQAKGMIAEHSRVDMEEAFTRLRNFARSNNRGLTDTARALVAGRISIDLIVATRLAHERRTH
ncbi:MAG: hypothetical protein JWM12_396 [Ilumatobacteraceae bacterium]|nr:hypothetical protein [Ilumatobacteraceae bacterium]